MRTTANSAGPPTALAREGGGCFCARPMGRQWLLAKREVNSSRKAAVTSKLVKEISVAAKLGGPDPAATRRPSAPVERGKRKPAPGA